MVTIIHLIVRRKSYTTSGFMIVDIGSEILLLYASVLLSMFGVATGQYSEDTLEKLTLVILTALVVLSMSHMVSISVNNCK